MKKIMFNDRYGLTEAVLSGRKTMTRRIIGQDVELEWARRGKIHIPISGYKHRMLLMDCTGLLPEIGKFDYVAPQKYQPAYDWDEEVAVAQSYKSIYDAMEESDGNCKANEWWCELCDLRIGDGLGPAVTPGYRNKMFVRADLMPHRIRITNIKAERLQDISDEDCLKEGLLAGEQAPKMYGFRLPKGTVISFTTPREAFAALIDRISGRCTWKSNPWVFVYEFELINKEGERLWKEKK